MKMLWFLKLYWLFLIITSSILAWTSDKGDYYHTLTVISLAVITIRHEEFF